MSVAKSLTRRQADWLSKTLAAVLPGLAFAFACIGWFLWYGPGPLPSGNKTQFAMWLVVPIWLLVLASVYLFDSGRQAWLVLSTLCALLYGSLFVLRTLA